MIKINGEVWGIRLVPPYHPGLASPSGPALGCCNDITKTIYLNNTLSLHKIEKVLTHEIVHAVMYSYNVNISDEVEEIVADIIATYGEGIISLSNAVYFRDFKFV